MNDKLPFGVKWARIVNFLNVVILIIVGLCLVAIAIPNFLRAAEEAGKEPNIIILILLGLFFFLIGFIPAMLIIKLNKALARLNSTARIWQIVISCLGLLAFPIGTILYGVTLYFMCVEQKTKQAFELENK